MLHALHALTVGLEIEITGGADDAVCEAHDYGLVGDDILHRYHCDCVHCEHDFDRSNILTGQEDCTVSGEFITRPIALGDAASWELLGKASALFAKSGAYASPYDNTGCHVHVGAEGLDSLENIELGGRMWGPRERLAQFFHPLQNDLANYARGSVGNVRDYNSPIGTDPAYRRREDWLHLRKSSPTVEFRLWNGTTAAWRWRMYAGISAAIVLATMEGRPPVAIGTPLTVALSGVLDDETQELMARQILTPYN